MTTRPLLYIGLLGALSAAGGQGQVTPDSLRASHVAQRLRFGVKLADGDTAMQLLDRMREYHVPGVEIAIIDNWRIVYARGFGVTEFGKSRLVDTTTLFLAGSISKPVFASGFLKLIDERKIPLDADINTLLKSWKLPESRFTEKEKVTLRRLLTHSAGLTVSGFPGYDPSGPIPTVPQVLDGVPPANTSAVRNDTFPGLFWRYSGGGMTIAQLAATDIAGESFPALMKRLVLAPAGMTSSTYENPPPAAVRARIASGHEQSDVPVPGGFHVYPEMAAAGLWTTAPDLARWAIAVSRSYRGEPGGFMPTSVAQDFISRQVRQGTDWWGLGVATGGAGDSVWFSHSGRDEGFVAYLQMWPNLGKGFVVLENGVAPLMGEIQRAYADVYGLGGAFRPVLARTVRETGDLKQYAGRYFIPNPRDTSNFDVAVVGRSLIGIYSHASKRSSPLAPVGGDVFVGLEGGGVWTFQRGADSSIATLTQGTGANRRVFIRRP